MFDHANCIMNSRKRKNSPSPEKERDLSKRARLPSNLWRSLEEATGSAGKSSSNSPSSVYKIKAIIGERPSEYLIDWADDPITGETFRPDWVSTNCYSSMYPFGVLRGVGQVSSSSVHIKTNLRH